MEAIGMDICILTETKIIKGGWFTKLASSYKVFASNAESTSKGGVALCVKENSKGWAVEDYETFGPNVIACTLVSGALRRRVIGAYVSPSEGNGATMDHLVTAVNDTTLEPLILGDFNVNLRNVAEDLNPHMVPHHATAQVRQAEIAATPASLGVENFGAHFRQRVRTGTWTWQVKREEVTVRSICDYILGVRGPRSERVIFHRVRRPEYVSTDHRVVYIGLPMGNNAVHRAYIHGRMKFPITIPEQDKGLADHLHDSLVKKKKKAAAHHERPGWISESTWSLMRRKAEADTHSGIMTRSRKRYRNGLRRSIRAGLKKDRQARMDAVADEIEAALAREPKRAFQLLANWYKRRAGEGLPLSKEKIWPKGAHGFVQTAGTSRRDVPAARTG
jgi:exonuclease III